MPQLPLNGQQHAIEADPQMPLLWVIRDIIGLTGTKFGCGVAACGAMMVANGNAFQIVLLHSEDVGSGVRAGGF